MASLKFIVTTLFFTLIPFNVLASDCNNKSPYYLTQGEQYFDIHNAEPLTQKQQLRISKKLSSLKKRFKGKNITISCEGKIIKQKLLAEIMLEDDGTLHINLEKYNKKNKSTSYENLSYFGNNTYTAFTMNSNRKFAFSNKYRSPTRRAVILNEYINTFEIKSGGIDITTTIFYNGYYAFSRKITLR